MAKKIGEILTKNGKKLTQNWRTKSKNIFSGDIVQRMDTKLTKSWQKKLPNKKNGKNKIGKILANNGKILPTKLATKIREEHF